MKRIWHWLNELHTGHIGRHVEIHWDPDWRGIGFTIEHRSLPYEDYNISIVLVTPLGQVELELWHNGRSTIRIVNERTDDAE